MEALPNTDSPSILACRIAFDKHCYCRGVRQS